MKTEACHPLSSRTLLTPMLPYRTKAGKEHRGYVANFEETVVQSGSVVTDYQFEQNIYTDSQFFKDSLERKETSDEKAIVVADGANFGEDNQRDAEKKNITLVTKRSVDVMSQIYMPILS